MAKSKKKDNIIDILESDALDMSGRDLLTRELLNLATDEVHYGWCVLDLIEKIAKARKNEMRSRLLIDAEQYGEEDHRGSHTLELPEGGSIKKEMRQGKPAYNADKLRDLLKSKDIKPASCMRQKVTYDVDHDSLQGLVEAGEITESDLEAIRSEGKVTYALKVKAPDTLPKMLKG